MRKVSTEGQTLAVVSRANLRQHLLISIGVVQLNRRSDDVCRHRAEAITYCRTRAFFNSFAQSGHCQNIDIRLGVRDDGSAMSTPRPSEALAVRRISRRLGTDGGLIDQRRSAGHRSSAGHSHELSEVVVEQKPTLGNSHTVSPTALDADMRSLATTSTRSPQGQSLCFGPFRLLVAQRLLLA